MWLADVRGCSYVDSDGKNQFYAQVACFHDGAATTELHFNEELNEPPGIDYTHEDLTGLGDRAFFRHSVAVDQAELWAKQGRLVVSFLDLEPAEAVTTKQCLVTLGNSVLATNSEPRARRSPSARDALTPKGTGPTIDVERSSLTLLAFTDKSSSSCRGVKRGRR